MPDYQRYERETKCPLFDSPLSVTTNIARTPIIIHKHYSPEHHITVIQAIQIVLSQAIFFFYNNLAQPPPIPDIIVPFPTNICGEEMKPTPVATHMLSFHSCNTHVPTSRKGLSHEWL